MREVMKNGRNLRNKSFSKREKADRVIGTHKPMIRYENVDKPIRITLAESIKVVADNGEEYLISAGEKITAYPNS
jgi:hypothetical protein